jgi:hypothetical protein
MDDNKFNLLLDFCDNECKFSKNDCCEDVINTKELCYCPAEHYSDWISQMLQQLAHREIWNNK